MSNQIIIVCAVDNLGDYSSATHIIRIVNPYLRDSRPVWFKGDYLQLSFGDVVSEADALACKTRAPSVEDIRQALEFSRKAWENDDATLIVSCDYGASRSPAVALVVLADYLGVGNEKEALKQVLEVRPDAVPNSYIVELGDVLLKRNGALRASLDDLYKEIMGICESLGS